MSTSGERNRIPLLWPEAGSRCGHWFAPRDPQIDSEEIPNWADAWMDVPLRREIELILEAKVWKTDYQPLPGLAWIPWYWKKEMVTVYANRW